MPALERNLRWYIAVRVVAVTSVLLPFLLEVLARPDSFPAEATHYARLLASSTFVATLVYIGLLRLLRRHLVVLAYIQFAGDLLLITVMVYYLGGAASPFSLLYLVIIAVASTLLRRRAGVTVASCAFLLYASLTLSLSTGLLRPLDALTEVISGWRVAYNLAIHFLGFYAMALLTSYLAHNATRAERELEVKSEHLADLQVVHRDVIQSISSGLITTDLAGAITSINQAGLAILRQPDDRAARRPADRPPGHRIGADLRQPVGRHDGGQRARGEAPGRGAAALRGRQHVHRLLHLAAQRRLRHPSRLHPDLPGPDRLAPDAGRAADEGPHGRGWRARRRPGARDRQPAGGDLRLGADAVERAAWRRLAAPPDRHPAQGEPAARPHDQGLPPLCPAARAIQPAFRRRPPAVREHGAARQQRGGVVPPPPGARPRAALGAPHRRSRPGEPDLLEPGAQRAAGDARRRHLPARRQTRRRRLPAAGGRHRPRHVGGAADQHVPSLPVLLRRRHRHRHGDRLSHRRGPRRPAAGRQLSRRRHHDHGRAPRRRPRLTAAQEHPARPAGGDRQLKSCRSEPCAPAC